MSRKGYTLEVRGTIKPNGVGGERWNFWYLHAEDALKFAAECESQDWCASWILYPSLEP